MRLGRTYTQYPRGVQHASIVYTGLGTWHQLGLSYVCGRATSEIQYDTWHVFLSGSVLSSAGGQRVLHCVPRDMWPIYQRSIPVTLGLVLVTKN